MKQCSAELTDRQLKGLSHGTGSPSSLVTVNMTLRNSVIIRVCMGKNIDRTE